MKYTITLNLGNKKITVEGTDVNRVFEEVSYRKAYWELELSDNFVFKNAKDDYFKSYVLGREYLCQTKQNIIEIANKYLELKKEFESNILNYPLDRPENYELFNTLQIFNPKPKEPIYLPDPKLIDKPEYPAEPNYPDEPTYLKKPGQPQLTDERYQFKNDYITKIFGNGNLKSREEYYKRLYKKDLIEWENKVSEIESKNEKLCNNFNSELDNLKKKYENEVHEWNKKILEIENKNAQLRIEQTNKIEDLRKKYEKELNEWTENNSDDFRLGYFSKESNAIIKYCTKLLNRSDFKEAVLDREIILKYKQQTHVLEVMYYLPDSVTDSKEIKYIKSKDKFEEVKLPDRIIRNNYENFIYGITLRTLYELFAFDKSECIDAIVFNGYVRSIDRSTGKDIQPCILSIMVSKGEFLTLNLKHVEVKACFRKLKGISASRLNELTPIAPIISFIKDDKRFIPSYEMQNKINPDENIAAMDWEDFEHLIREIFEKEFSVNGGEVKVTRASRDGGVDAIAFDPDPIRGGKIVIQAKRYTNTVGVSAVRDLYGTVLNEGATKGILVSTADYGSDAYEFAKGKPLTLLNGSNLLHLLEKHGYHVRIDLNEAKKIFNEKEK